MCNWLGPDYEQDLWIPNHNKITLSSEAEYARELFGRPRQRLQFHSALGQAMLATARTSGGYVEHISWFSKWDMNGLSWHTRDDRSRLHACPASRLRKMNYTGGVIYTSRVGCLTSGHKVAPNVYHCSTLTAWTTPRPPRSLPSCICQGKRMWAPRSCRSRRRRRRRHRTKSAAFARLLYRLLRDLWNCPPSEAQCPMHGISLFLRLQCMHEAWVQKFMAWLMCELTPSLQTCLGSLWAQTGYSRCSWDDRLATMGDRSSDSEVIERRQRGAESPPRPIPTTPNGTPLPRGPPPPRALHEHRDMSLALSNAIGQAFLEQGS